MHIQIFAPPKSEGYTFQSAKVGDIGKVISYKYTKHIDEVGKFELVLERGTLFAGSIQADTLLYIDRKQWLIVEDVVIDTVHTIKGTDLKGLLKRRITLYPSEQVAGAEGYDVYQGTTESVIKHYIRGNITAPTDPTRKMPRLTIAADKGRGIAEDTYMSRFEPLHELVNKLCRNASIGYDITASLEGNNFIFDVYTPPDLSINQSTNNRVIFAVERGNITGITQEHSVSTSKNAFYATKNGGTLVADAVTVLVHRNPDAPVSGWARREMQLNINVDTIEDIDLYALKDAESYQETHSYEVEASTLNEYGTLYDVGCKVTISDADTGTTDTIITTATETITTAGRSVELTFGHKKPLPLTLINRKITNKGV